MKALGIRIKLMAMVNFSARMDKSTRDNGKMIGYMDKDLLNYRMVLHTKEIVLTVVRTISENIHGRTRKHFTKDNGSLISSRAVDSFISLTIVNIMATLKTICFMGMEFTFGPMAQNI
jgi:hypothetical protein